MHKVYHRIEQIAGNVIVVTAEGVIYGELAQVTSGMGTSLAQVIRLEANRVSLQVFAGVGQLAFMKDQVLNHPGSLAKTPFSFGPRAAAAHSGGGHSRPPSP